MVRGAWWSCLYLKFWYFAHHGFLALILSFRMIAGKYSTYMALYMINYTAVHTHEYRWSFDVSFLVWLLYYSYIRCKYWGNTLVAASCESVIILKLKLLKISICTNYFENKHLSWIFGHPVEPKDSGSLVSPCPGPACSAVTTAPKMLGSSTLTQWSYRSFRFPLGRP